MAGIQIKPYKLISKQRTNATASKYISTAATVETTKIETYSGNKKGLTTVINFFDTNNKIIHRIIEKKFGKNFEKIIFSYSGDLESKRFSIIERFVNKKKIETIIKSETLNNKSEKPFLTRVSLFLTYNKNNTRNETQIIEELSTHKHRKYIKTTAIRDANGELSNKTIEGNTGKLRKLKKYPYLYFINYSLKDFLKSIIPHAKKTQKVSKREITVKFKQLEKEVAANSQSFDDNTGIVTFDLSKEHNKYYIVDHVNHELRHQYQQMIIEKYKAPGFKGFLAKIQYPFKHTYQRLCKRNFQNYISSAQDKEKYRNQFIEIDARLAAEKARQEYFNFTNLLDEIFPKGKHLFIDW